MAGRYHSEAELASMCNALEDPFNEAEIAPLWAELCAAHNRTLPISGLPLEIMVMIFRLTVGDGTLSDKRIRWPFWPHEYLWRNKEAVLLTHVCHLWRQIALAEPFLWNLVKIEDSPGRRQDEFNAWLNLRSLDLQAEAPFDVYITHYEPRSLEPGVFAEVTARCSQLRTLYIHTGIPFPQIAAFDKEAPLLEHLHIRVGNEDIPLPELFSGHTPLLTHLMLDRCMLSADSSFTTLTHLCLYNQAYSHSRFSTFASILSSNSCLRELRLQDCVLHAGVTLDSRLGDSCLPVLKQLSVIDCGAGFIAALLTRMKLVPTAFALDLLWEPREEDEGGTTYSVPPDAFWSQWSAQSFRTIRISGTSRHRTTITAASEVSAVRWNYISVDDLIPNIRRTFPFSALHTLQLCGRPQHLCGVNTTEGWQRIFGAMLSLETLALRSTDSEPPGHGLWLAALAPSAAHSGEGQLVPAPSLRTLLLSMSVALRSDSAVLLSMTASRAAAGHRLHALRVLARDMEHSYYSAGLPSRQTFDAWFSDKDLAGRLEEHVDEVTFEVTQGEPTLHLPVQFGCDQDFVL